MKLARKKVSNGLIDPLVMIHRMVGDFLGKAIPLPSGVTYKLQELNKTFVCAVKLTTMNSESKNCFLFKKTTFQRYLKTYQYYVSHVLLRVIK